MTPNQEAGTERIIGQDLERGIGRGETSAMYCANQCDVALYVIAPRYSSLNTHSSWISTVPEPTIKRTGLEDARPGAQS